MYSKSLLLIAVLLVTGSAMGQNSVEYGKLPMVPPKLPSPASGLASRVGAQSSGPKVTEVGTATGKSSNAGGASQENKGSAQPGTVPKPVPPAVFILANGERLESKDYTLTHDSLQIRQNDAQRTIPLSAINVPATQAANKQRGIDLKIPTSKSQMVLAF